jgi:hypothetical protein
MTKIVRDIKRRLGFPWPSRATARAGSPTTENDGLDLCAEGVKAIPPTAGKPPSLGQWFVINFVSKDDFGHAPQGWIRGQMNLQKIRF